MASARKIDTGYLLVSLSCISCNLIVSVSRWVQVGTKLCDIGERYSIKSTHPFPAKLALSLLRSIAEGGSPSVQT